MTNFQHAAITHWQFRQMITGVCDNYMTCLQLRLSALFRLDWIEQCLTSPPTQYRTLSGRQFYRSKTQPTLRKYWRKNLFLGTERVKYFTLLGIKMSHDFSWQTHVVSTTCVCQLKWSIWLLLKQLQSVNVGFPNIAKELIQQNIDTAIQYNTIQCIYSFISLHRTQVTYKTTWKIN